ncbi:MAG: carboxypeptidase-like regulatory domain-containing protein [Salibacteraceae bacterium]
MLLISTPALAQEASQSIRGRVIDKDTRQPLPGVNVIVMDDPENLTGTSTDAEGRYELDGLSIGRHTLKFSFIGYTPQVVNDVILNSGRQTIVDVEMEESAVMMEAVEISASRDGEPLNEMALVSARQFNVAETERFAGSRGEPSRMASNFAGVQGADDSRNDIVIRGNSPQAILWRMNDLPISNPNHFNIPGTAGGSISILNNKTMANSDFYTGAFPAEFGNATAGVFDLNLRTGNNQKHEFIGQFGFLGTEALVEGPIDREKNITYLAAYRYSTLAIVGGLGIEYGTDAIPRYQDGAFHINIPGRGAQSFSVFGIGGISDIDILISDQKTPDQRNIYGDNDRDQYFGSDVGIAGMSYTRSLNENSYWKTSVAFNYSAVHSKHDLVYRHLTAEQTYAVDSIKPLLNYRFQDHRIAGHTFVNSRLNQQNVVKFGVVIEHFFFDYRDSTWIFDSTQADFNTWRVRWNSSAQAQLIQPYVQWKHRTPNGLTVTAGVHSQWFTLNNSVSWFEPRIAARKELKDGSFITAGTGLHTQTQPYYLYFFSKGKNADGSPVLHNKNMDFTYASHFVLGHERMLAGNLRFKTEVYYQYLWNIPVEKHPSSFSLANTGSGFERFFPDTLVNKGTQQNMGIEFTLERYFSKNYFAMFTLSLFDSKYTGSDGVKRNTDFNGRYAANALFGYEIPIGENSVLSVGTKVTAVGGRWYGPPDTAASNQVRELIVIDSLRNTLQFRDYFRADLKINLRLNARRVTHEIGIDLVNVFNTKNILTLTYAPDESNDPRNSIREEYQLGRLPLFYYRISF